ncbi:MAG: hypothetical protein K8T90_21615 [Planctomycetes bacterium]|nr:hypothetical protein [Planctomycetota bacterium]
MSRPIVTVIYAELTAPVVRAQTPPLLRAWRDAGRRVDAAAFTSPRALFAPGARTAKRNAAAVLAAAIGREPWLRTHLPRDIGLTGLGTALATALRDRGDDDAVLFCRQPRAALVGIAARDRMAKHGRRASVVLDLRGLRDEEYLLTLGKSEAQCTASQRARLDVYRTQERDACRGADSVLCVSRPMMRIVKQRYGLADERLGRAPNHSGEARARSSDDAEATRTKVRAELGVADGALLVIYSGTMAAWQKPDTSALLVKALESHRPDVRLLFLTPEQDAAKAAVAQTGLKDVLFRSAKGDEVERYLCAADYGLLLRDESLVNLAACPVKFGEYLACGVRPILTPGIGDQSDLCRDAGLGVVIGLSDVKNAAKQIALDLARPGTVDAAGRAHRRAWAEANITPGNVAARILEFVDGGGRA